MFFWKKDKAKDILKTLGKIEKSIRSLKGFEEKKNKTQEIIIDIKRNIQRVEGEIILNSNQI
ncbi:MAG TPA: hypothetical protein VI894_02810 [Candidatus Nanoarchaeia archaeon]|nr:hypothetical protein [Candidatus Nanoarchaeia archaeon]